MARRARERRQVGGHQREVEGALAPELGRPLDHPGVAGEAAGLLGPRAQVGAGRGREPPVDLVEAAAGPHRGQRGGQRPAGRRGVVHVVGGQHVDPGPARPARPARRCGPSRAGRRGPTARRPRARGRTPRPAGASSRPAAAGPSADQRGRHRPLAATGEHQPVVPSTGRRDQVGQLVERRARRALLARELGLADRPGQAGVALRVAGQHEQVALVGAGRRGRACWAGGRPFAGGRPEGQLGPEHRGQPEGPGRLGEADHAVEAVVVGERQRLEPEPGRLLGQLLGVRRPVEEAEVGVAVQLGVGHRPGVGPPARSAGGS